MRTVEESITLIDTIVGRCVREPAFARRVMADPRAALRDYELDPGELADFLALKEQMGGTAVDVWDALRGFAFQRAASDPA